MSVYTPKNLKWFILYRVSLSGFFDVMSGDNNRSSVFNTLPNQMFPNAVDDKEFVLVSKIKLVLKIDKHNLEMSGIMAR